MSNIYCVYHKFVYDDPQIEGVVGRKDLLGVFDSKEEAEKFAAENSDEHEYDDGFECGRLTVEERPVFSTASDAATAYGRMWWKRVEH